MSAITLLVNNSGNIPERIKTKVIEMNLLYSEYQKGISKVLEGIKNGGHKTTQDANKALSEYKEYIHKLESNLDEIEVSTKEMFNRELNDYISKSKFANIILILIFVSITIFSIIFSIKFISIFTKSIQIVLKTARLLAAGNLKQEKIKINTTDEMAILAFEFNNMLESLTNICIKAEEIAEGKINISENENIYLFIYNV